MFSGVIICFFHVFSYKFNIKQELYLKLLECKNSDRHKPLILKGARQVDKIYILKEFGNKY